MPEIANTVQRIRTEPGVRRFRGPYLITQFCRVRPRGFELQHGVPLGCRTPSLVLNRDAQLTSATKSELATQASSFDTIAALKWRSDGPRSRQSQNATDRRGTAFHIATEAEGTAMR